MCGLTSLQIQKKEKMSKNWDAIRNEPKNKSGAQVGKQSEDFYKFVRQVGEFPFVS